MTATFKVKADQGELRFTRLRDNAPIPKGAVKQPSVNGHVILGHSESGHHHVMLAEKTDLYQLPDDLLECLINVRDPDELTHLRDSDTHEPIRFEPGKYRVRKLREYTSEGFRRQAD